MFDLLTIVPWLQTKGTNPLTGKPLDAKDLIKLNFTKNEQGEFCDPVTMKVFNDHTHILAIAQSGNVFAQETIERLNYKAKHWKDLMTDEPFSRSDVITIQDPHNLSNNTVAEDVRASLEQALLPDDSKTIAMPNDKRAKVLAAQAAIEKLRNQKAIAVTTTTSTVGSDRLPYNAAHYSTGYTAASFTNSGMAVRTADERAILTDEQYLLHPKKVKTKALCIVKTNLGNLDLELWPEHAPKAVYNFVKLSARKYYDNVSFHRNIPGFMIQGGDPTGRGTGGISVFGKEFEDEISPAYSHDKRGLVCMANKGPATNSSQFFITYDSARHLDKKHTIFGQVIGNLETLDKMEVVPCKGDKPREPIIIQEVQVVLDPFEEYLQGEASKRQQQSKRKESTEDDLKTWNSLPARNVKQKDGAQKTATANEGKIGLYIPQAAASVSAHRLHDAAEGYIGKDPSENKRKRVKTGSFGDFSGW